MGYKGSGDAIVKILKSEGPMGLYRGALPTILKQGTNQAVRMPAQVFIMDILIMGVQERKQNPLLNGAAGFGAGIVSVFLTQPQDCVKSRMQSEAAKQMYLKEGPTAFFAGSLPRCIFVGMTNGISFTLFPIISQLLNKVM